MKSLEPKKVNVIPDLTLSATRPRRLVNEMDWSVTRRTFAAERRENNAKLMKNGAAARKCAMRAAGEAENLNV
jgi:hypothetical protein